MRAATAAQSRSIDRRAIEEVGIPSLVLMENAGRAVVAAIERRLGGTAGRKVVILCGKGNNGGDGLVVARHLHARGADVRVFLAGRLEQLSPDAALQARMVGGIGLPVAEVTTAAAAREALAGSDLAVDALLGTGTRGEVTGLLAELIEALNASPVPVVAVDVPSGLNADTGQPCGCCVRAVESVTFGVLKRGLVVYPGAGYAGEVTLAPISIPPAAIAAEEIEVSLVEPADARALLPTRDPWAHKGSAGSVLVLGGSAGMTGAAALAALAAMRIGAGLVRLAVPRSLNDILEAKATEVVTLPVAETEGRSFTAAGMREALARAGTPQCVALGPGLSQHPETVRAVYEVLPTIAAPLVIDADGLNALAEAPETFDRLAGPAVITPHPGEMSRLLRRGVGEIQADRIAAATEAARRFGVVAVLKGARTVIAEPGGAVFINATGNAAMASAGMGDVLTGAIAGLIAQGLTPLDGAILGVFLHGLAGDLAATAVGGPGIVAGDVQERLPAALAALRGGCLSPTVRVEW